MKKKEKHNFKEKTQLEIKKELNSFEEKLFNLRFQLATGHLEDASQIRKVRRDIAFLKTLMREKELVKEG